MTKRARRTSNRSKRWRARSRHYRPLVEPLECRALLATIPVSHSNPWAAAKLYLDFDGHFEATWGSWTNATTPAFDQDGDRSTFSDSEIASITEIWTRVSEDYAPFNVDVTTVDP